MNQKKTGLLGEALLIRRNLFMVENFTHWGKRAGGKLFVVGEPMIIGKSLGDTLIVLGNSLFILESLAHLGKSPLK